MPVSSGQTVEAAVYSESSVLTCRTIRRHIVEDILLVVIIIPAAITPNVTGSSSLQNVWMCEA
jgi:hypothetical protein